MNRPVDRWIAAAVVILAVCAAGCNGRSGFEPLPAGGTHVLFVGNSLTYTNELPATVESIARAAGDTFRVASVVGPDLALIDHLNGATAARSVIRAGRWDFVVLQQGPSSVAVNRDTLVLGTQLLDPHIRASSARAALYMVWPSSDRIQFFTAVRDAYRAAADAVDGIFLPAGEAWQTAWRADAELPLYGGDGYHASRLGTYLAALVMYEQFTGKDARALPTNAIVGGAALNASPATIRLLQEAAHETNAAYVNAQAAR
jgi:hypothetical protein